MSQLAIIDIGSTSVGGALLEVSKKKQSSAGDLCTRLITTVRNDTNFQENIDLPRYLEGIVGVLKKTLDDLVKTGKGAPSEVVCFLSAPFYASQTRTIIKREKEPFTVTERMVDSLVKGQIAKRDNHELVESLVMRILLDGYHLDKPYKQKASDLAVTHYFSIASTPIINRFREIIAGAWHHREITFHSFAFSFYQSMSDALGGKNNFLILDIGGEITEISLIWHGLLWETISFPLGRSWLIRKLAKTFNTTPAEAMSSLKLYRAGTQHKTAAAKIEKVLATAKEEWLGQFREALSKILDNCLLPEKVFALAEPGIVSVFRDWLKDEQFEDLTIGNKKFTVNVMQEDVFRPFCAHGDINAHDFTLMVEAIYCDKIKNT